METRSHIHEEILPASPERVFTLLHTPSAIRQWWGAARAIVLPEPGGFWCAAWGESEDEPDYISAATLRVFDPPRRILMVDNTYFARSGPLPFEFNPSIEFLVSPHPEGAVLRVTQTGFPAGAEGDSFLESCVVGWTNTFKGIRKYLE